MLISIIITNHNYSKYIHRCIRSCLFQNFPSENYEVIFIDDASTDSSVKEAKKFTNFENFKIIKNKTNLGVAKSSNIGFKNSNGKYIVRVDSDDYINKEFIRVLYQSLVMSPKNLGAACDYFLVSEKEQKIKHVSSHIKPISCGIMYNKSILSKYNFYNPKFRHREEEELRTRIGLNYTIKNINLPLYRYRIHGSNKTETKDYKKIFKEKIHKMKLKNLNIKDKQILKNIVAIIPARGGSKRLKNKNILQIKGKPMIEWVIDAAKNSYFVNQIYVSSENKNILKLSKKNKVKTIKRSNNLADDVTPKIEVIRDACLKLNKKPSLIVSLQANSPNMNGEDIDNAIYHLLKHNLSEVMSVDENNISNGAIRVMKKEMVFYNGLSVYNGFINTIIADIHTKQDITTLLKTWK